MGFQIVKIFLTSGDLQRSKVKVKPPKKIGNTFIPAYNRYTHSKLTQKVGGPLLAALAAAICSLLLPNCEGSHSVLL